MDGQRQSKVRSIIIELRKKESGHLKSKERERERERNARHRRKWLGILDTE